MASKTRYREDQASRAYSTSSNDTTGQLGHIGTGHYGDYDTGTYNVIEAEAFRFHNHEQEDLSVQPSFEQPSYEEPSYEPDPRDDSMHMDHYSSHFPAQWNDSYDDNNGTSSPASSARQARSHDSPSATRPHGRKRSSTSKSQGSRSVKNSGNDLSDRHTIIPEEGPPELFQYPSLGQGNVYNFQEQTYNSDDPGPIVGEDGTNMDQLQEIQKNFGNLTVEADEQFGDKGIFHGGIDPKVERWRTITVEYRNSDGWMQTLTALKDSGSTVGNVITMSAVKNLGLCDKIIYFEEEALIETFIGAGPIAIGTIDLTAAAQTETFTVLSVHHHYDIVLDATWCYRNNALARGKSRIDRGYKQGFKEGYGDGYAAGSGLITTSRREEMHTLRWLKKESRQEREKNTQNSRAKNSKAAAAEAKRKNRPESSGLKMNRDNNQPQGMVYYADNGYQYE